VSRIVAVSPLLGDAAFSAGGTVHRHARHGHELVIVTVFTATSPLRAPDDEAAKVLNAAGAIHLALDEAAARGYDDPFTGVRDDDDAPRVAAAVLTVALGQLEADLVLGPAAIDSHVDRVIVDRVLEDLALPRLRWLEQPYAMRHPDAVPEGERVAVPLDPPDLAAKLDACTLYPERVEAEFGDEQRLRTQLTTEAELFVRR
jgi:hypothetical protein